MNDEVMDEVQQQDEEFDAGFSTDGERADEAAAGNEGQEDQQKEESAEAADSRDTYQAPATETQVAQANTPAPIQYPAQATGGQTSVRTLAEVPEVIADELELLKKLNPAAAELAMEDSAEGEAIRKRLENYGAEQAQDRAEMTLYKRQQAQDAALAYRRANAEIIKNGVPDFYALMNDPKRVAEKDQYLGNLQNWIGSKSFKEGTELMQVYTNGRPEQVCELIKRFENEKSGRRNHDGRTGTGSANSARRPRR